MRVPTDLVLLLQYRIRGMPQVTQHFHVLVIEFFGARVHEHPQDAARSLCHHRDIAVVLARFRIDSHDRAQGYLALRRLWMLSLYLRALLIASGCSRFCRSGF